MKKECSTCGPITADIGLLVLRVVAGVCLAVNHGWVKFHDPEKKSQFFSMVNGFGLPASNAMAWAAIGAELVGGALLALGLFTRLAAFMILCTMGVAIAKFHWPMHQGFASFEFPLVYAAIALCLLFAGGGRISLGAMLFCRRKDNKDDPEAPEEVRESMRPL